MRTLILTTWAFLLFSISLAAASDIEALETIKDASQAQTVCEQTCAQHDCGWSGEWKKGVNGKKDSCDCGPVRIIKIPGGVIRSQEQAVQACTEICSLNDSPWTGEWERFAGGFDLCSCKKIADWCEPKT